MIERNCKLCNILFIPTGNASHFCKECVIQKRKEHDRLKQTKRFRKLRKEVLNSLGNKCIQCGHSDTDVLQVDHINGGGSKEIKSFPSTYHYYKYILEHLNENKYQLLCANCNWKKRVINKECNCAL